ncbi:MAG: TIGR00375 family protein [Firmicutes bacterium]|nr:TIGR00375 family protein [Bacillota bacterium]
MRDYFADLHIHLGRTLNNQPVKITASPNLTLRNILTECQLRKGLDLVGIVDTASPGVLAELEQMVKAGELEPLADGGLRFKDRVTLILGAEFETTEPDGGQAHWLAYFPSLEQMWKFSRVMSRYVRNLNLSTQRCQLSATQLAELVWEIGGLFVPAHAFTPHKSVYGSCISRLTALFPADWKRIVALELGLSADSDLADHLAELRTVTYLSNSDAHSLEKIGREYNVVRLARPSYEELVKALQNAEGRQIVGNYGLDPRLGKYHRSSCLLCHTIARDIPPPVSNCPNCGSERIVKGVLDRLVEIADYSVPVHPPQRAPYYHQIPLRFLPGVGERTVTHLIDRFGSEMAVLHAASPGELAEVIGEKTAELIIQARQGKLNLAAGGGGRYGRVIEI